MKRELPKIRVSISNRCQLRCSFCGGDEKNMENFQPDYMYNRGNLTNEQLFSVIEEYLNHGGLCVQFTGGEPLLRRDIVEIVHKVKSLGGVPEINTNGIAITQTLLENLKTAGLNVLKISLPSFFRDEYQEITQVDAFNKVMSNIGVAKDILPIRVNMVATKYSMSHIADVISICKSLEIKQLLLLELLYYPTVNNNMESFFDQYTDVVEEYGELIAEILGAELHPFYQENSFESSLYSTEDINSEFQLVVKRTKPVYRIPMCKTCPVICQEGIYELRLSTGGYLNLCNKENKLGYDVASLTKDEISNIFSNYLDILSEKSVDYNNGFYDRK